ncbi:MAG: hypothetical protein U0Q22_14205 [Acidimicrobiales bacterium]
MTDIVTPPTTTPTDERDALDRAVGRVLRDAQSAQAAAAALRVASCEPHDRAFALEVGQLLSALQLDVAVARAECAIHGASAPSDLAEAIEEVAHVAEVWLGDGAVRESLDNSRGRSDTVSRWIDGVATESRRTAKRAGEALDEDLAELRRATLRALHSVRVALADALAAVRHHT